jgi:ubiquitin thioesterase protein OTUB1
LIICLFSPLALKATNVETDFDVSEQLLTSAWMKLNAVRYQSFLPAPLEQYCASRIETVKTEIDEVGLQALVDGVISSSGIAVEILYLDRSEGSTVTPHMLSANPVNVATIRLLYRPYVSPSKPG